MITRKNQQLIEADRPALGWSRAALTSLAPAPARWALGPGAAASLAVATVALVGGRLLDPSATGLVLFGACCAATLTRRDGPYPARAATLVAQCAGACLGLVAGSYAHGPAGQILLATVLAFFGGLVGQLAPALTGAAVMASIGVSLVQFGHLGLTGLQLVGWEAVGSAVLGVGAVAWWLVDRRRVAALPASNSSVERPDHAPLAIRLRTVRLDIGLRISWCIGVATTAAVALDGHTHAYWIPITVAVLVRPEYGTVFVRSINRLAGTILGGVVGGVLLAVLPAGLPVAAAVGVAVGFAVAAAPKSYALSVVGITCGALLSTTIATPVTDIGWVRVADTLIGAAIAVIFGYLGWPGSRVRASSTGRRPGLVGDVTSITTRRASPPLDPTRDRPDEPSPRPLP